MKNGTRSRRRSRSASQFKKYAQEFYKLLTTCHPANLEGEIAGHGSNDAWAGKKAKELLIDPLKIPYEI